ncbi:MAG: DUF4249 family protein [Cyclobacteriaceae bacterium]
MKTGYSILPILLVLIMSCEDVIKVDTPSEEPRLSIDALLKIDTTDLFQRYQVKVRLTDSFFGQIPVTKLKQITIGAVLNERVPGSGNYEGSGGGFQFYEEFEYILQVEHQDQRYLARATNIATSAIDTITQVTHASSNDGVSIAISFKDAPDKKNFYLFDMGFSELMVLDDAFFNGQTHQFIYKYKTALKPDEQVEVAIMGIDEAFHNYMKQLISQSVDNISPFDTPVATLRGNIINVTEIDNIDFFDNVSQPENFALGYFAIAQIYKKSFIVR